MRVRSCFFVKVRKAKGRNVVGGSKIGKIDGFTGGSVGFRIGWTGVPKAGEEEGTGSDCVVVGPIRNKGAVRSDTSLPSISLTSDMEENERIPLVLIDC